LIERVSATDGRVVLRFDGRLLSSTFDPVAEAREWLARRETLLREVKTVFVLGAGSGYHIAEMVKTVLARIVVIEPSTDLAQAVREVHAFSEPKVTFANFAQASRLRSNTAVRDGVRHSFVVLRHPASIAGRAEFFDECEKQLLARDWGNLNWQWSLKGMGPLDAQMQIGAGEGESALTIYDLEKTELVQNSDERERMLIKALRELVK
jgi:hypothetical protein